MTTPARNGLRHPRVLLAGAALSLMLGLGAGSAHAAAGPAPYADGLHVPAGGLVDPDNRVWVSDHNGGFCRVTTPTDRGLGTLDHPSTPGSPASETRTCLGGLLPDAAPGPDAAGQPAFTDPTPELPGSGDELALVPDGASPSMAVWRAHWNPQTRLFEADPETDVISMNADTGEDRPRPTAVSIAPDGNAYVVFQRSSSIQRIVAPDSTTPRVELVGFTSDAVGTAAIAAGYGPLGPIGPPTVYVGESAGVRQISGVRGDASTTTSESPFGASGLISTLAYQVTDPIGGQGTLFAGTADAVEPVVLPGPDRILRLQADAAPAVVATGFSTVGGMAIRPDDGALFVFDDPALVTAGEPLGRGRGFVIGEPFSQILSGPSRPEGQPALDDEYTADATPTFTYSGEFTRQCSLTAAGAATNSWEPCGDDTTYTASGPVAGGLADGRYRFAVRSVDGPRIGRADTRYFTVDTVAPTATPLILNPKQNSNHLRAPRLAFDNSDTAEAEFGYQCKIDDAVDYTPCAEGLDDSPKTSGAHTLQIKLVDGAGNVGTVESDSTPTVEDDPATTEVDEHELSVGAQPTAYNVGADPATRDADPAAAAYAAMTHPDSAAIYGEGLHVSTGAMEDPAGRVWVTDHNAGFCRMTDPTTGRAGQIEHPELPNQPRTEPRTCLGGLLPDAGPGADAAGPPAFVDPTPKRPGNGDEVVLIADGFAGSNFLVRLRWDPGTELFEYLDQITVPAIDRPTQERPRPVTTQVGPDPDGADGPKQPSVFFVSKRDTYIGRIDQPAADEPSVHVAGFVSNGGVRSEVLAVGQRTEDNEQHPVVYLVSQAGLERLDNPRIEGEPDAPANLNAGVVAIPTVTNPGALAYDLKRDLLYVGTAEAIVTDAAGVQTGTSPGSDRFLRVNPATMEPVGDAISGFSMIGGIGLRNDGRILVVDDAALLDPAEPMGMGLLYQIGNPAARITSGPSDPENNAAASFTSSRTPAFGLAGDTPRQCWVRPAGSTAAPDWQACDGNSLTTSTLADGAYKLTVRSTAGSTPESLEDTTRYVPVTKRFTVDTVAPARPSVTDVQPKAADGITSAAPYFTFAGESGVSYSCVLNGEAKNPCRPGRTFPLGGTPAVRHGANSLTITAIDKAGNVSPVSPGFPFTADAQIPVVTISSPDQDAATGTEARFVFKASSATGTTYGCRLDGVTFKRCDQPSDAGGAGRPFAVENLADGSVAVTYRNLTQGEHHFQVHASDPHRNISPNASRTIHVETNAPVALVDAPAPNATTGRSTTLRSHIDPTTTSPGETNTLACTLTRGGTPVALPECDEDIAVSNLQDGLHTFTVQATDGDGNVGPVGSRTWRVDGLGPVITIAQQGTGFLFAPTFTITTNEAATLQCRYDARPLQDCASVNGANLGRNAEHTLTVIGTDAFANVSQATRTFRLFGANSANTVVPATVTRAAVLSTGLPVTFTADQETVLARFQISRIVEAPNAGLAQAASKKKKVTYKRIATVKRMTPKPGIYRRKLNERALRKALTPGLYRVETRLKSKTGGYGEVAYSEVRVKAASKVTRTK